MSREDDIASDLMTKTILSEKENEHSKNKVDSSIVNTRQDMILLVSYMSSMCKLQEKTNITLGRILFFLILLFTINAVIFYQYFFVSV